MRKLGNSNIEVTPLGFGCMGLSHAFGTPLSKEEAAQKIIEAYEIGYNFFDTAECYTGVYPDGAIAYNEDAVGLALQSIPRDQVIIDTKTGVDFVDGKMVFDASPERIRKSCEKSLQKLGTDYIDLYYLHRIDPKVEPEVVAQTMGELIKEGKIRSWGISVTNEELAYAMRAEAARYPGQERKVLEFFQKNHQAVDSLSGPIFENKVVDYLVELAQVTEREVSSEELLEIVR